jgi:SRSO17 transposase
MHQEATKWPARFGRLAERIGPRFGPRFGRRDLRRRAEGYLRGLLGRAERKNGWQLAEAVGDATPHGVQRLLRRARWDADAVRDDLRRYVVEHLGDPRAVLVVDETGFLKKGTKSAGVARQYSGTAGRVENCQIGVFLAYHSERGVAFLDRALYLPKTWAEDADRRRGADVPEDVAFATKPELARRMVARALRARVPKAWVTADQIYGGDVKFRRFLENKGVGYVVAVSRQQRLYLEPGGRDRVDAHAADLPGRAWRRLSCGAGTKGERVYDWAFVPFGGPTARGLRQGLLVRRGLADPADRAYYFAHFPPGTPAKELVRVAGARWSIESAFEQAKQETGLGGYEVRSWTGWHRHVTLSLLAHAFLAVLRAEADRPPAPAARKGGRAAAASPN